MRRALAVGALAALVVAGVAEARGHRLGGVHAPHAGGRHRSAIGEIKGVRSLGPAEFRPYEPARPLKPFSYVDHERRGGRAR
jgi:hypothetical protein